MKKAYLILFILSTVIMIECAGQLAIRQMMVEPPEVTEGSEATILVVFTGQKNTVSSVVARLREDPEIVFSLNDNGESGDKMAGDNIWTYSVTVPLNTLANTYHFDISARDLEGNEIITEGYEQQITGRSGTVEITVK